MPSPAEPKRYQRRALVIRKPFKPLIPTKTCAAPLIDIFNNSGPKALDISNRLTGLEVIVKQIEDLSLKLAPLASLIDSSNARKLAAQGRFFDSLTKKAAKLVANTNNAVVNAPERLPLPLVQLTVLSGCNMTHHSCHCFRCRKKISQE